MSDTPRTDAKIFETLPGFTSTETVVLADFARQLERELTKERTRLLEAHQTIGLMHDQQQEYSRRILENKKPIEQMMHDLLVKPHAT